MSYRMDHGNYRTLPLWLTAAGVLLISGCNRQAPSPAASSSPAKQSTPDATPHQSAEADVVATATNEPAAPENISVAVTDYSQFEQRVADLRGKVVLVDFWATWCGPCREGFAHTVDLTRKYADQGFAVISVSFDDPDMDEPAVRKFLESEHATFDNLISRYGSDDESFEMFAIDNGALPHLQLFDREGKLIEKFVSGDPDKVFTPEDIERAVQNALAAVVPVPPGN